MTAASTRAGGAFASLVRGMNGAGVVWIFALTFLICADITGRTMFARPIAGVTEMVSLSLIGCVFLQIAHAIRGGRLMQVEMVLGRLGERRPALVSDWQIFLLAVSAAVLALIAIGAWPDFAAALRTNEFAGVEGIFKITVWPIKLLLVVGFRRRGRRGRASARRASPPVARECGGPAPRARAARRRGARSARGGAVVRRRRPAHRRRCDDRDRRSY